jgi:sugar lactone lactonase YvrE
MDSNHGELDRVTQSGAISRVIDISAKVGHVVPTAIAYDGNFYVGTLGTFENNFQAMVLKITPSGQTQVVISGLTSILGLVVRHGTIYVLENEGGFPVPCAGRVLRVNKSGHLAKAVEIASGLMLPTAMTLGPDDALYVSVNGFGFPPTFGQVVRIQID